MCGREKREMLAGAQLTTDWSGGVSRHAPRVRRSDQEEDNRGLELQI